MDAQGEMLMLARELFRDADNYRGTQPDIADQMVDVAEDIIRQFSPKDLEYEEPDPSEQELAPQPEAVEIEKSEETRKFEELLSHMNGIAESQMRRQEDDRKAGIFPWVFRRKEKKNPQASSPRGFGRIDIRETSKSP